MGWAPDDFKQAEIARRADTDLKQKLKTMTREYSRMTARPVNIAVCSALQLQRLHRSVVRSR